VFLYAFDVIELNGDDLRYEPLEMRKAMLEKIPAKAWPGLRFNELMEATARLFSVTPASSGLKALCRSGSVRPTASAAHGTGSRDPAAPAVKREAEEDWGKGLAAR
jgi:hypothetical protein